MTKISVKKVNAMLDKQAMPLYTQTLLKKIKTVCEKPVEPPLPTELRNHLPNDLIRLHIVVET